ncbi:hypothetical protein IWW50_001782, partial [Coemansia erecta]
ACHPDGIACADVAADAPWFCELSCRDNARRRRILVELPKCRLPYMCSPRHSLGAQPAAHNAQRAASSPAPRTTRTRKRKAAACASPEPMQSLDMGDQGKVRKSSRVARPSMKRLETL